MLVGKQSKYEDDENRSFFCADPIQGDLFLDTEIFSSNKKKRFTFIDLFAGIGGFRIAGQSLGGCCIFSSEFDKDAVKTYSHNFNDVPFGDITLPEVKDKIPNDIDVLCAGFPCQPFSVAGYRKGFEDTRGTLFYDVAEIVRSRRPKVVFLENVKNLKSHDNGRTFEIIKSTLEELNYCVHSSVMNAMEYANVPQNRERIFIVCFDNSKVNKGKNFKFPDKIELTRSIHDCIEYATNFPNLIYTEKMGHYDELVSNIIDENSIYQWRRQYVRQNKSGVCPTLTANMGTGGHNVPLIVRNGIIRKLSPRECLNFQGFPASYKFPSDISNSAKYKQAGNSVVVPLIRRIFENILKTLE